MLLRSHLDGESRSGMPSEAHFNRETRQCPSCHCVVEIGQQIACRCGYRVRYHGEGGTLERVSRIESIIHFCKPLQFSRKALDDPFSNHNSMSCRLSWYPFGRSVYLVGRLQRTSAGLALLVGGLQTLRPSKSAACGESKTTKAEACRRSSPSA